MLRVPGQGQRAGACGAAAAIAMALVASACGKGKEAEDRGAGGATPAAAFDEYAAKSKATEAKLILNQLYRGAQVSFLEQGRFPGPSAGPVPSLDACCKQGGKCAPSSAQWDAEPWRSLGFSVDDPHYYSYAYEVSADGRTITVMAQGDLDCDGVRSSYSMTATVTGAEPPPWSEPEVENELE
jgi:hypothetical protein